MTDETVIDEPTEEDEVEEEVDEGSEEDEDIDEVDDVTLPGATDSEGPAD
jgi:hypothetical protein